MQVLLKIIIRRRRNFVRTQEVNILNLLNFLGSPKKAQSDPIVDNNLGASFMARNQNAI